MNQINSLSMEIRPWGKFYIIDESPKYKIKRIEVNSGHRLSYQYHNKRSEAWTIIKGIAHVTLDGVEQTYNEGETVLIPVGVKHRVKNVGKNKLVFIEVQTGQYFGEDDIVRVEDDYNRVK